MTNEPTSPNDTQQNTSENDDATVEMPVVPSANADPEASGWRRTRAAQDSADETPEAASAPGDDVADESLGRGGAEAGGGAADEPADVSDDPATVVDGQVNANGDPADGGGASAGPDDQPNGGSAAPSSGESADAGHARPAHRPGPAEPPRAQQPPIAPGPEPTEQLEHAAPPHQMDGHMADEYRGRGGGHRSRERVRTVRRWSGKRVAIVLGIAVGLVVALYGAAYALYGNKLADGASVVGIDVGGLSPDDAVTKLEQELPGVVNTPMVITVDEDEVAYEIVPDDAGLSIDVAATVDEIPGGSLSPASLVGAFLGGDEVQPVPVVDNAELVRAVEDIASESNVEPVNGGVAFDEGKVVTSEPTVGREIDVNGSVKIVTDAFFGTENASYPYPELVFPSRLAPPDVTQEEVDEAVAQFAQPAMSAPVAVEADGNSVDLSPELIGQALTMAPEDGTLQPSLDGEKLAEVARNELAEIGQEGKDATIVIENNEPVVIAEEDGLGVAPDGLSEAVLPTLTESGEARVAEVQLTEVDPALTADLAEELGVEEVVSEFTTTFPHAPYRNVNIGLAAEKVDDTLLMPGDTFSLNGLVGERTAANGFAIGGIISGGVVVEDYGGGVSQVATTTYHAAFEAGLEDVEHRPHSIYFSRYPIAQEATVSWGNFDMAFKNDTPHGVVVDTEFTASTGGSQGVLTVKLWSTPYYEVETSVSSRRNFTEPSTVYNSSSNCIANSSGSRGFSITSFRKVWNPDGELVKDEADPWTYRPNPKVICGEKPDDEEEE